MKNRIKFTAFILSLLTLFGCVNNPTKTGSESFEQNSEISSTDVISSSDSENTESGVENSEQFLKAPAGEQGFVFDRDTFRFTTKDEMVDIRGMFDPHTSLVSFDFEKYMKYLEENNFIFAKVRIVGESFQTIGDIKMDGGYYLSGVYTPVLIEEVVDSLGNESVINKGDIVYTREMHQIVTDEFIQVLEEELNKDKENFDHEGTYGYRQKTIDYYKEHTIDNSLVLYCAYPMETGKSYLIAIQNEKVENHFGIDMLGSSGYALNLGDSAPDSYPDNDFYLYHYSDYTIFWRGCKELYGTYFE